VATDHAPHARPEKQGSSFLNAAFGLIGSELALPLMLALVRAGEMTLSEVVAYLSVVPARLWGLDAGTLNPGAPADIVVFDPDETWRAEPGQLVSRGANTPLIEIELRGRAKLTFVGGDERHRAW
jgi:dihydroorotase